MPSRSIAQKRQEWLKLIDREQPHLLRESISHIHPADQSEIIRTLNKKQLAAVLNVLEDEQIVRLMQSVTLDRETRLGALRQLADARRAAVLSGMSPEAAAEIVSGLSENSINDLLSPLPPQKAREIFELAAAERKGIERIMTRDIFTVREDDPIREVLKLLRKMRHTEGRPGQIYITDHRGLLSGAADLHTLLLSPSEDAPISTAMKECPLRIPEGSDPYEAARRMLYYGLGSAPVVNRTNELIGVIRADAAYRLLEQKYEGALNFIGAAGRLAGRSRNEATADAVGHAVSLIPIVAAALAACALLEILIKRFSPEVSAAHILAWAPLSITAARLYYWHTSLLLQKYETEDEPGRLLGRPGFLGGLLAGLLLFAPACGAVAWWTGGSWRLACVIASAIIWTTLSGTLAAWVLYRYYRLSRTFGSLYMTPALLSAGDFVALAFMAGAFYLLHLL